jgi:hypothetical protein
MNQPTPQIRTLLRAWAGALFLIFLLAIVACSAMGACWLVIKFALLLWRSL